MSIYLDLQVAVEDDSQLPSEQDFQTWLEKTISQFQSDAELTIRIVDQEESHQLNFDYRGKDKPTNVLSFPADPELPADIASLGDLAICLPVVEAEAREQDKRVRDHFTHLFVHGLLHLVGYDHETEAEAFTMESLEVEILHRLGEIPAGSASVVIAAAAPHRGAAYEASRLALERLKREVPIWKREDWAEGSSWGREAQHIVEVSSEPGGGGGHGNPSGGDPVGCDGP